MEMPRKSPLDQLHDVSEGVNESWERVIECVKAATYEYLTDMSDEEKTMLEESFWPAHTALIKRAEVFQLDIEAKIFERAEMISNERRAAKMHEFDTLTLPGMKRRELLRAIIGLPNNYS